MQTRYSLRFESGDKKGETVAIPATGLTIGRKEGNGLRIADASVSGNHARLTIDAEGVKITDLGSTNGTRVGTARVTESRLQAGDTLYLGNVKFEVVATGEMSPGAAGGSAAVDIGEIDVGEIDLEEISIEEITLEDAVPAAAAAPAAQPPARPVARPVARTEPAAVAPVAPAASAELAGEAVAHVSAATLERAKKSSKSGLLVVGGLVVVLVGAWFALNRDEDNPMARARAVQPLTGNLLPAGSWSFEGESEAFRDAEGALATWSKSAQAASSGQYGLRAELAAGEWALTRSEAVTVSEGQTLVAKAQLRAVDASVRVGVEFLRMSADGAALAGPVVAWSAPLGDATSGGSGWTAVELGVRVPLAHTRARVVLLAEGATQSDASGRADADDVGLVVGESARVEHQLGEARAVVDGACAVHLEEVDRVLCSGLAWRASKDAQAPVALAVQAKGARLELTPQLAESGAAVGSVRVGNALLAAGGVATLAKDGTQRHSGDFSRDGVEALLLGGGNDLVKLALRSSARVEGRPDGDGLLISWQHSAAAGLELQAEFGEEKKLAGDLAHAARNASKKGEAGLALAKWSELLDRAPFDAALVEEASRARSQLVEQGLADLRAVRQRAVEARFFALAPMCAQERAKALELAARYAGSEVSAQATALADELSLELDTMQADDALARRARLVSISQALESAGAKTLAARVKQAAEGAQAPQSK